MEVREEDDEGLKHSLRKIVTKFERLLRPTPIKNLQRIWNNLDHRTVALSCLVKGVYKLEQERQEYLRTGLSPEPQDKLWWESFNFTLTKKLMDPTDHSIYGAIFDYNSNHNTPDSNPPPRPVIAFRGTMLKRESLYCDLTLDLCCLLDSLHRSSRFKHALKVTQSAVKRTGNIAEVWLAGHSLGAAMVLLAGKIMTRSGFPLESHLFNPPFPSIPIETLVDSEILKHGVRVAGSLVKAGIAKALRDKHHHKNQDDISYTRLASWRPYLYLNQSDWFCSEYIGYFMHRAKMTKLGAEKIEKIATKNSFISLLNMSIRRGGGSSSQYFSLEPLHVLPSAYLKINT